MAANIRTSISVPKALLDDVEKRVEQMHISRSQFFQMAVEQFIKTHPSQVQAEADEASQSGRLVVNQGDVFWAQLEDGIPHPHVVIQDNLLNHSRIQTVAACALTSNLKRASLPGNVLLEAGEANLPKPSVVEASKVSSIPKAALGAYIGAVSAERISQILAGMRFLQASFYPSSD